MSSGPAGKAQTDPVSYRDMTKWPCTPTIARLNRAEGFIDNLRTGTSVLLADGEKKARILLQAQADAEALGLAEWLRSFEEAALAEAARAYQEGKLQDAPETIWRIAFQATSEHLVGMCIHKPVPLPGAESRMSISITALMREPSWTGMNRALPLCQGLEVHIFEHQEEPGRAGMIIACGPGNMAGNSATLEGKIRGATNRAILKAVSWHGAVSCTWHPKAQGS